MGRWLTIQETAKHLGMSPKTVYNQWPSWSEQGVVPSRLKNSKKMLRFDVHDLDRMMEAWRIDARQNTHPQTRSHT